jgi:hypothetical protein
MASEKIYLERDIHCFPHSIFISFAQPASRYCEDYMYTHTHTSDFVGIAYEVQLLPNNTARGTFLHKSGAVRNVDWIFLIGAGMAVTGRIRDIGQNVLQSPQ